MILENERPDDTLYVMNPIDFSQIDPAGYFKISLPGGCQNVICKTTKRVSYPNGNYTVLASVEESEHPDGDCGTGDMGFVREHGITVGIIRVDDRAYEIRDLKEGKWRLRTVNTQEVGYCPSEGDGEDLLHDNENVELRNELCLVQLLILFDTQSNAMNDIQQRARLDVERTNRALRNSGISDFQLRFEIIGFQEFNLPNPREFDFDDDLIRIRDLNQHLQDTVNADIVVFYTSTDYMANFPAGPQRVYGAAMGLRRADVDVDPKRDAYMLVQAIPATRAAQTFEHEIAHLFQCRHQNDFGWPPIYARGHRFEHPSGWFGWGSKDVHTITHTLVKDVTPIPYYSNPSVIYRQRATGTEFNNNARQLREGACEVANFREGETFAVMIEGDNVTCPYHPVTLTALIMGNSTAPFTVFWESATSFDGPFSTLGNTPIVGVPVGEQGQVVFVRLTVTNAFGQTITEFFEIASTDGTHCTPWLQEQEGAPADLPIEVQVWPNPAGDQFGAKILVKKPQEYIRVDLLSSSGEVFQSRQWKEVPTGPLFNEFNTSALPSGIYRLRVVLPQGVISTPIVKR